MATEPFELLITATGDALAAFGPARAETLTGAEDDMWATLAEQAQHYELLIDGQRAGCCTVDDEAALRLFHIDDRFDHLAADVFDLVVHRLAVTAALACTVDPRFLSLSLAAGRSSESVGIMFEHVTGPPRLDPIDTRAATQGDRSAVIAFDQAATNSELSFLGPYLTERIDRGELFLVESADRIIATGECRVDRRTDGLAHLGLIVDPAARSQGLGTRLLCDLVDRCRAAALEPRCSTDPGNLAALQVIRRTGFRSRHQVFAMAMQAGVESARVAS